MGSQEALKRKKGERRKRTKRHKEITEMAN